MTDASQNAEANETERLDTLPKKSKLPLVMGAVGVVGLAVGVFFATRGSSAPHSEGAPAETHAEGHGAEGGMGPVVNLDSLVVNLSDPEDLHYLKCSVAIELTNLKHSPAFERQNIRVKNAVLIYLSSLRMADTAGAENKEKIQQAIKERVSEIVGDQIVKAIYFTEFVLQ